MKSKLRPGFHKRFGECFFAWDQQELVQSSSNCNKILCISGNGEGDHLVISVIQNMSGMAIRYSPEIKFQMFFQLFSTLPAARGLQLHKILLNPTFLLKPNFRP